MTNGEQKKALEDDSQASGWSTQEDSGATSEAGHRRDLGQQRHVRFCLLTEVVGQNLDILIPENSGLQTTIWESTE